jgi:hypothetical protein
MDSNKMVRPGHGSAPVRDLGDKVRVFIGTEPKTEIARKVLQCSITRRTEASVEFVPMIGPAWEYPTEGFHQGTGFSLRRWMIPAYCGWHGRAIYLDSDQLVFSDIWDLWTKPDQLPRDGCAAWLTYQISKFSPKIPHPNSSVMVIDCAAARAQPFFHLDACVKYLRENQTREAYGNLMFPSWMKPAPVKIGVEWNSLNTFAEGKTRLLHYTKEDTQPWVNPGHLFADQWKRELQIALTLNYVTVDEIRDAIKKFNVKEDWRSTNGMHPDYVEYIKDRYKATKRKTV